MSVLVVNAGSSSLKFSLFEAESPDALASGLIDWTADRHLAESAVSLRGGDIIRSRIEAPDYRAAVVHSLSFLAEKELISYHGASGVSSVGHRVVHGGTEFRESVLIDDNVKKALARLADLAPLHNPPAIEAIVATEAALPGVPQVAVFDTAFYALLPRKSFIYPLPYEWYTDWGIRRFGFHGISHSYCVSRAAELLGRRLEDLRIVSCHLGNGCSATAIRYGIPISTTMGFTPMDGLMMGSRPGSLDPGILLYLQQQKGFSASQIEQALNHGSGLLGVSGVSSDFREVEEAASKGNDRAKLALEIYSSRVREAIGALTAAMGGIDVLIFTAGVGENSATLRASVCDGLECLGLMLDGQRNGACRPDVNIAAPQSRVQILVIHTREDLMIAREASRVIRK